MEIASLLISILVFAGSIFLYCVHDRKIKKQEIRINEYELTRIDKEKEKALKATFKASYLKDSQSKGVIKIKNDGCAKASNVRADIITGDLHADVRKKSFPCQYLNPGDSAEIEMVLSTNTPDTIEVKIMWDDDFQPNNEYSQRITLK